MNGSLGWMFQTYILRENFCSMLNHSVKESLHFQKLLLQQTDLARNLIKMQAHSLLRVHLGRGAQPFLVHVTSLC